MPIRNAIWKVGASAQLLSEAQLPSEKALEDMIVAAPSMLSELVGNQNTVCNPRTPVWRRTVDRLQWAFGLRAADV